MKYKPTMILGHPRSGTNFISTVVRSHPEVNLLTEPFSLHYRFVADNRLRYWSKDDYDHVFVHKKLISSPEHAKYFNEFKSWLYSDSDELRMFKETTFFLKLEWLKEYLADLKIIYVLRDPRGVASSFKKFNLFKRQNYENLFQTLKQEVYNCEKLKKYERVVKNTNTNSWIDILTTIWYVTSNETDGKIGLFHNIPVRFENLARKPYESFLPLFDFIGLEMNKDVEKCLDERCSIDKGGVFSTYRNSPSAPERWKNILTKDEISFIEKKNFTRT